MRCQDARALSPGYLDGELSAEQAHGLRSHLMDCAACRAQVQGERALQQWFVAEQPIPVPRGFAERVARRAFAGDTGELAGAGSEAEESAAAAPAQGVLLSFALHATAAAAILLLVLCGAIATQGRPSTHDLLADDATFERAVAEIRQRLRLAGESAELEEAPDAAPASRR